MKGFFRLFLVAVVLVSGAGYSRAPAEPTPAADANALFVPDQAPELFTPDLTNRLGHAHFVDSPALTENILVLGSTAAIVLGGDAADGPADYRMVHTTDLSTSAAAGYADDVATIRPFAENTIVHAATPISAATPARASAAPWTMERLFPARAPAERSGWTLILCSFVVVGFMAQRQSRLIAG
jgi:hypothetical protein